MKTIKTKKKVGLLSAIRRWAKRNDADVVVLVGLTKSENGGVRGYKLVDWRADSFESGEDPKWSSILAAASEALKKISLGERMQGNLGEQIEDVAESLGDAIVNAAQRKVVEFLGKRKNSP